MDDSGNKLVHDRHKNLSELKDIITDILLIKASSLVPYTMQVCF